MKVTSVCFGQGLDRVRMPLMSSSRFRRSPSVFVFAFLMGSCGCICQGEEPRKESRSWKQRYQTLLKERPEIRKKLESGGTTKQEVLAWMKRGGDRQKKRGRDRYYGWKVEIQDPDRFNQVQDGVVFSGPQPGEELPPFSAVGLNGNNKNHTFDPSDVAKGVPHLLVFQDQSDLARKGLFLLGPVLQTIAKNSKSEFLTSVVFLGDDPSELDPQKVRQLDQATKVYEMSHSPDGRDGPGSYGLNRNVAMTILIAQDKKVRFNFAFTQPMLYPDPHVVGALAEILGERHDVVAGWLKSDSAKYKTRQTAP